MRNMAKITAISNQKVVLERPLQRSIWVSGWYGTASVFSWWTWMPKVP